VTAEPVINQWGQYLIDGVAHQRVTTLAGMLEARQALERWKVRQVGRGLALRQDLLAKIAACPEDDKTRIDGICEMALEAAAGSAGANTGDALHQMSARIDAGEDFTPPPPWDVDIKAYRDLLKAAGIKIIPRYVEKTVVLSDWKVAGTFDRVVMVKDKLYVLDLKTGRDLSYGWLSIAIQLACYAHAGHMWDWERNEARAMPVVSQERALVVHLPAGTGTAALHVVDIAAGWEAAQAALQVKEWRARKDLARPARLNGNRPPHSGAGAGQA
jgi:hypothetical protein